MSIITKIGNLYIGQTQTSQNLHQELVERYRQSESNRQHLQIKISLNETESFSFVLKFAYGLKKYDSVTNLTKNHEFTNTEFKKYYIQGILASTLKITDETTLPSRYIRVLNNLSTNKDIIIAPSVVRCGITIVDLHIYIKNLGPHLDNDSTSHKQQKNNDHTVKTDTQRSNKTVKKIIKNENKSWT